MIGPAAGLAEFRVDSAKTDLRRPDFDSPLL